MIIFQSNMHQFYEDILKLNEKAVKFTLVGHLWLDKTFTVNRTTIYSTYSMYSIYEE